MCHPEMQQVLHPRSDEAVGSSEARLWLWASLSSPMTYVFKTDVRVLREVRVSVPWAVAGRRAPAVPVFMVSTLGNDAWLWRQTLAPTLDWFSFKISFKNTTLTIIFFLPLLVRPLVFPWTPAFWSLPGLWALGQRLRACRPSAASGRWWWRTENRWCLARRWPCSGDPLCHAARIQGDAWYTAQNNQRKQAGDKTFFFLIKNKYDWLYEVLHSPSAD